MSQTTQATRTGLKTPRAAAIAGIVFSILLLTILALLRESAPAAPLDSGEWLVVHRGKVELALHLMPFAGVAFLWFIGVLRDRLGAMEDKFFATVFLGSGILVLAMLFMASALIGALLLVSAADQTGNMFSTTAFSISRATIFILVNVYAVKLAGVFLFSMSTVVTFTRIAPRWMAVLGYLLALSLVLGSFATGWIFAVFPIWVLIISIHMLVEAWRSR